jgi:hypothetical protein
LLQLQPQLLVMLSEEFTINLLILKLEECYKTLPTLPTPPTLPTLLLLLQLKPLTLGLPKENKLLLNGPPHGIKVELLLPLSHLVHPLSSTLDSLKATPTNGDVKSPLSTQSELMLFINPVGNSVQPLYQLLLLSPLDNLTS